MVRAPTTLTTSGQISHHFGPSSSTNNDTATLLTVIAALFMRQKSIYEFYGRIGHKDDACTILSPKFVTPSLRININKLNALNGDEPTDPPREWNSQPPTSHFKYSTYLYQNQFCGLSYHGEN